MDMPYDVVSVVGRILLWIFTVESLTKNLAYRPSTKSLAPLERRVGPLLVTGGSAGDG